MQRAARSLIALAVVGLVMSAAGCASLAVRMGMASQEYVDEKLAEITSSVEASQAQVDAKLAEVSGSIDENRTGIDQATAQLIEVSGTADKVEQVLTATQETIKTTEELKQLASVLEERLIDLPDETIRRLVGVLQDYLEPQEQ